MKPYWKPQHEVFIRSMLKHEDPTKAYRTAYPKSRPESARVGGIRLFTYPHIRRRIEPVLHQRRVEEHQRALEQGAERERREHDRMLEMRRTLYKVVMKQLQRKRVFTINGRQLVFEEDPSTNTILNAMVLDLRLEAGYDNWPVIERRFARIMASLLPREKRVQTVTNSSANPIKAVISSGAKQSVAQGELSRRRQISREHAIGHITALQEIFPSVRNDALIVQERKETISGISKSVKSAVQTIQERSVMNSLAKPAQVRLAAIRSVAVNTAFVTKAVYHIIYPPPNISLSPKSV